MDHRWGQRVAVDLAVQLLCHPRTIAVGRLMNVSVSGAYVRTGLVPALLAPVRILGFLSESEGTRREAHRRAMSCAGKAAASASNGSSLRPRASAASCWRAWASARSTRTIAPARSRVIRAAGDSVHRVVF